MVERKTNVEELLKKPIVKPRALNSDVLHQNTNIFALYRGSTCVVQEMPEILEVHF